VFGEYELNAEISDEDVNIVIEGRGKTKHYKRNAWGEEIEKIIHAEGGKMVICPVEPVNLPKEGVAQYLLIELEKPFIIEPKVSTSIFLRFPVEIGVFLVDRRDVERIDLFSKVRRKYTLYGPPEKGVICRWWRSGVYDEADKTEKFVEGIIKVDIENDYTEWVELRKIVFGAVQMKIFYGDYAYMHARMKITGKSIGEVSFIDYKPKKMKRAIDIYLAKGMKKFEKKFVMEWGFK